jgi:hypothetical protein
MIEYNPTGPGGRSSRHGFRPLELKKRKKREKMSLTRLAKRGTILFENHS